MVCSNFHPQGKNFVQILYAIFFVKAKITDFLHIDQALKPNSGQDRNIGDLCMTESLKVGNIMKENQS